MIEETTDSPTRRWHLAPAPPSKRARSVWSIEAVAVLVAVAGPILRVSSIDSASRAIVVATIAVVAALAMGRISEALWPVRLAVAMAAGIGVLAFGGRSTSFWLFGSLVLADWAGRGRAPAPFLGRASDSTLPGVVVLSALAAWRGRAPLATVAPLVITGAALVLTFVGRWIGPWIEEQAKRFGRLVGRIASRVVFLLLGLPLVVVPWLVDRLVRVDPLAAPTGSGSSWVELVGVDPRPTRPWNVNPARQPLPAWARWRRTLALPLLVLLVALPLRGSGPAPDAPRPLPHYAAFAHDAWWPELWREMSFVFAGFDARSHPRFRNEQGRYINIVDGDRVSWQPPTCRCRRLTVWVYGGSTLFGLGQRDDHTITSDLARIAWQNGVTLDVVNKGVPGDAHWIEAERFGWDVVTHRRPDLVLFYDGVNELQESTFRNNQGRGTDEGLVDVLLEESGAPPGPATSADGIHVSAWPTGPRLGPVPLAHHAVDRYDATRKLSADVGAANAVPVVWFWQPSRFSRPEIPGEPRDNPVDEAKIRRYYETAAGEVRSPVVNLDDALDGTSAPIFFDDVHTNELGAELVAQAMYDHIAPQLRALEQSAAGTR